MRPEVRNSVVASSGSQLTIKKRLGGTVSDKTLETIFNEVSIMIPEQTFQRIKFKLETLKKEDGMECLIEGDDEEVFELMIRMLKEHINGRSGRPKEIGRWSAVERRDGLSQNSAKQSGLAYEGCQDSGSYPTLGERRARSAVSGRCVLSRLYASRIRL